MEDADQPDLYQAENGPESVENLVMMQLVLGENGGRTTGRLWTSALILWSRADIFRYRRRRSQKKLGLKKGPGGGGCCRGFKLLEPRGIFASGLEECLLLQIQGMEQEEALKRVIKDHLQDVAEGRLSSISRDLKLSSAEVRS